MGGLASKATQKADINQAANLIEQLAAIEHERWSDWQKWVHKCMALITIDGTDYHILPADVYQRWERQIATKYADLPAHEKQSDRDQVMRYWPLIEEWVNGLVENKQLASKGDAKKPSFPPTPNREVS